MSSAEVIDLISSKIAVIEAAKKMYDAAADAKGQPEEFRQVAARLPLVIGLLDTAKGGFYEDKAESLQKLFRRVVRKDDDKWYERYKKAVAWVTIILAIKLSSLNKRSRR
ncbi:hypothetical protein BJ878DRAFT_539578 [Calycina marina]|uniref:NACHT-NTPase and P-loop NTPases N-terminal domain-containing protein n=1 Tax=Calycina marina TaxID=1763456 RepID=A0A9P7Z8D8_9HELO|nr:hypothetical protein BJ878DRAFT_539578 [Calycina marina]